MKLLQNRFINILLFLLFTSVSLTAQILEETVTDYDGNVYQTVKIGTQVWLKENLKSLHYSDGTPIPGVVSYNNNDSLAQIYGRLYDWNAAMKNSNEEGAQGICPDGWHIPSSDEWAILESYLGGSSIAGGKMKDTTSGMWRSPNSGATNSSGFTGLPAGEWDTGQGRFRLFNEYAVFWTSTSVNNAKANERYLSYKDQKCSSLNWYKSLKYSIRAVKDEVTDIKGNQSSAQPSKYRVEQNYPNPFNPSTHINYYVPEPSFVKLQIYDVMGRLVDTLVNNNKPKGNYSVQWNGKNLAGEDVASGNYIYRFSTNDFVTTGKMQLLR